MLLNGLATAQAAQFTAGMASGAPGDTDISVDLTFTGDGNLAATQYTLAYDSAVLTVNTLTCPTIPNASIATCNDDGVGLITMTFTNVGVPTLVALGDGAGSVSFDIDAGATAPSIEPLTVSNAGGTGTCRNTDSNEGICNATSGQITITGTPSGTITPDPLDLGSETFNVTTAPLDATLTSDGTADLIVSTPVSLPTNPSSVFAIGTNNCTNSLNLSTNGTCTVSVTCTPTAAGPFNGVLRIPTNAGNIDTALLCAGLAPNGNITSPVNFGTETIAVTSAPENATVTSTGTGDLIVSGAATLLTNPAVCLPSTRITVPMV
ncbi:MAG: hypothetical protein R3F53_12620 [Gammaproteobacteria bacterium]